MREIPDSQLTLADVPGIDANWDTIVQFALTYNGYKEWGSFEKCAVIANTKRHGSLGELRTCLFFEQRRWNHYGDIPDDETMAYIRELLVLIREKLRDRSEELPHS